MKHVTLGEARPGKGYELMKRYKALVENTKTSGLESRKIVMANGEKTEFLKNSVVVQEVFIVVDRYGTEFGYVKYV